MKKLLIGNWKMKGEISDIEILGSYSSIKFKEVECVIAAPFIYIGNLKDCCDFIILGAQDVSKYECGEYTGEISAKMLKGKGVKYVIIGHSERRKYFNEDNITIKQKLKQSLKQDIIPILCIGESEEIREKDQHKEYLKAQLLDTLNESNIKELIIAYEPLWSIGTGKIPQNKEIEEVARLIKEFTEEKRIESKILYGGSVNSQNISKLLKLDCIDGYLVGGASLTKQFEDIAWEITKFINNIKEYNENSWHEKMN